MSNFVKGLTVDRIRPKWLYFYFLVTFKGSLITAVWIIHNSIDNKNTLFKRVTQLSI